MAHSEASFSARKIVDINKYTCSTVGGFTYTYTHTSLQTHFAVLRERARERERERERALSYEIEFAACDGMSFLGEDVEEDLGVDFVAAPNVVEDRHRDAADDFFVVGRVRRRMDVDRRRRVVLEPNDALPHIRLTDIRIIKTQKRKKMQKRTQNAISLFLLLLLLLLLRMQTDVCVCVCVCVLYEREEENRRTRPLISFSCRMWSGSTDRFDSSGIFRFAFASFSFTCPSARRAASSAQNKRQEKRNSDTYG
jgi:hypothetical protein